MKLKTLKADILLYFILFTAIPLIIGSSTIIYQMYQSQKESVYNEHKQILNIVENETNNLVKNIEDIAQYIKKNHNKNASINTKMLLNINKDISNIMFLDNKGILKKFTSNKKLNIYKGYDYSNMEYFKIVKSGKAKYWSKVYFSYSVNSPAVSYTIRLDKNTIVVIVINLSRLNKFAARFRNEDEKSMVMIVDDDGIFLASPDKPELVYERKNIFTLDIYKKYIKNNYEYKQIICLNSNDIKSIGIYGRKNKLGWYIIIKENYYNVFKEFNIIVLFILIFIVILLVISIYASLKLSKSILKPLDILSIHMDNVAHGRDIKKIRKINYKELDALASNFLIMEEKIKNREEQNRQKDQQIFEASKLVQMGEMIGNIAHQWRQPLSVISTAASGMKLEKEYDLLTDEKLNEYCDSIINNTDYLSRTIDTFRNFIKDKKDKKDIILQNQIDEALNIVSSTLRSHFIELINKIDYKDKIKLTITVGELSQVIINIINNSKDILIEKKIEEPFVIISCYRKNDMAIISIEDNGGGIPEDIISKVFEPYFTTKHQSQGTGLGLHMSYKIITESLNGKLYVKNTDFGAKFYIELPLNSKV